MRCRKAQSRPCCRPAKAGDIVGVVLARLQARAAAFAGKVESQEVGLPGVHVELDSSSGKAVQTATAGRGWHIRFQETSRPAPTRPAILGVDVQQRPWNGYSWLGPALITWSAL